MSVERVDIDEQGSPWKEEHLSRYYFIRDKVAGKIVLDIACGTGFGTELMLENNAAKVFAADVSDEAIEICTKRISRFPSTKATCHKQDGTRMTYDSNFFDMVVSFETIEHIPDYMSFLSEIHRVLKPGGLLVMSTPNALVTNPDGGTPKNPYHVYEFTPEELKAHLSKFFDIKLAAGQHIPESYGVAPFLPSFNRNKLNLSGKVNFLYWRAAYRMPDAVRNGLHKIFYSSSFYPKVEQYTFLPDNLNKAHVQYFICQKKN